MKIRTFKTYILTDDIDYFSIHFLPTISYEGFRHGDNCIFIGWLTWGLQIKWTN